MKIAYVVTSGDYSSYGISSVFSTEAKAQDFIQKHGNSSDYSIEEWKVDEDEHVVEQTVWEAAINADTGDMHEYRGVYRSNYPYETKRIENSFKSRVKSYQGLGHGLLVIVSESTVSADHAIKVAGEARQLYLRTGIIPPNEFQETK